MKLTKRLGAILMMAMLVLAMSMSASAAKAKINKKNLKLTVGQTANLKVKNTTGKVKWSSSDATVATVKKGKVTAVKAGTAVITAKNKKKTYKCNVTVEEAKTTPSTEAPTTTPKTEEPKSADKVVVINDANFAQEFDKYFGKVVVSTYYVDKDGNLLTPNNHVAGSLYEAEGMKFDKNGNPTAYGSQINDFDIAYDVYAYYLKTGIVSDLMTYGSADMQYHVNLYELNISGNKPVFSKLLASNPLQTGYAKKKPGKGADETDTSNYILYDYNGVVYDIGFGSFDDNTYSFGYGYPNASQRIGIRRMEFPKDGKTGIYYQRRTQFSNKLVWEKGYKVVEYSVPNIAGRMMLGWNYAWVTSTTGYNDTGNVDFDPDKDVVKQAVMLKVEDEVFRNVDFHLYLR